jgi:hypothetical protein
LSEAVEALLLRAPEGMVNVRSYAPDSPRSREFLYGLADVTEIVSTVNRLTAEGLHTIVNETIDVADGGVSGVLQGGVIEFAPDDTPRCVEKPGTASLPQQLGMDLLEAIYGFRPDFGGAKGRVEFSVHPQRRGWRGTQTLLWEQEDDAEFAALPGLHWPNRFSRHIGDKLYGLLMAHLSGSLFPGQLQFHAGSHHSALVARQGRMKLGSAPARPNRSQACSRHTKAGLIRLRC